MCCLYILRYCLKSIKCYKPNKISGSVCCSQVFKEGVIIKRQTKCRVSSPKKGAVTQPANPPHKKEGAPTGRVVVVSSLTTSHNINCFKLGQNLHPRNESPKGQHMYSSSTCGISIVISVVKAGNETRHSSSYSLLDVTSSCSNQPKTTLNQCISLLIEIEAKTTNYLYYYYCYNTKPNTPPQHPNTTHPTASTQVFRFATDSRVLPNGHPRPKRTPYHITPPKNKKNQHQAKTGESYLCAHR